MSRDAEPKNDRLFDKRTIDRNIKKGLVARKDYDKHIKSLEDVAAKGVYGGGAGVEDDDDDDELEGGDDAAE
ncbi:MAG TPA: hypothetical protein VHJ20_13045 [Polyangia bacterium]|nr:hypothetical protein [Polyangia bacterium]